MADVVSLDDARAEREPHWAGKAVCVGCRHEWVQVAPAGVTCVGCPSCGLPKGFPKFPFGADEGDALLTCSPCGGDALTAYKREGRMYVRCMGCGTDLTEAFYG
jgi:hypothetical protein